MEYTNLQFNALPPWARDHILELEAKLEGKPTPVKPVKDPIKFRTIPNPNGTGRVWAIVRTADGKSSITNYSASGPERFLRRHIERLYRGYDFSTVDFR